jgi:hypothetical protein
MENGESTAARSDALQWLSNAKDAGERERANQFIKALDGHVAASAPVPAAIASDAPTLSRSSAVPAATRQTSAPQAAPEPLLPSVRGTFEELDCSGPTPKFVVLTNGGKVVLSMEEPDKIVISGFSAGTIDMHCGRQKSSPVTVRYEPAAGSQTGVAGHVKSIQFGLESQTR